MPVPSFKVAPKAVGAYAEMFDITLTGPQIEQMAAQLAGGFAMIAQLWDVDVSDVEPSVIFPIDRKG
jgi:hypothetical protein